MVTLRALCIAVFGDHTALMTLGSLGTLITHDAVLVLAVDTLAAFMLTRAELIASIVIESVSPIGLAVLGVLIAATVIITVIRFLTATAITAILISSVGTILASIATTLIAMLEQIIATLGLGIAHAGAAFRTVAVLLVGLAAVLALRLVIGSELIAGGLVPGLGLDDVLLVTVAIAVTLALAAAAAFLAPLFLPLRGLPTGCDLSRLQPSTRSARLPTSSSTSGES